ncbi:Klc [Symbiodinium sp. CCMP2592]|nr:Klc [Symbiodinium sp. CCMP2592]
MSKVRANVIGNGFARLRGLDVGHDEEREADDQEDDGHDRSWDGVRHRMALLIAAGLACAGLALWALYSWQFPAFSLLQEARSFSDSLVSSLISNLPVEVQG